jgi:hypothetical protein
MNDLMRPVLPIGTGMDQQWMNEVAPGVDRACPGYLGMEELRGRYSIGWQRRRVQARSVLVLIAGEDASLNMYCSRMSVNLHWNRYHPQCRTESVPVVLLV